MIEPLSLADPGALPGPAPGGWRLDPRVDRRNRLRGAIDRLLSSAAFRRRAARFAPTRMVARRRTRALFDLCAGFVYSQVLLAVVRLKIPQILLDRPLTAPELTARLGLPAASVERLLRAATSLRLVSTRRGGRFGIGALGTALIDNPGVTDMIEHHGMLYDDLRDPVELLRGGARDTALGHYWPYAQAASVPSLEVAQIGAYTALMASSQPMIADAVLDAYPMRRHRCLLDVGGGSGGFVLAALQRHPGLRAMLFDLRPVVPRARVRLDAAGVGDRVTVHPGDFARDPLPDGADIVSLVRVLHDHDDPQALVLLRAIRAALPPGGTVLLAEPMAEAGNSGRVADAYFGFYLLAMGSGRPRRRDEIETLLSEAGFSAIRCCRTQTPLLVRVLVARA